MVLFGPRPTQADLAYNELARHRQPPPFDGTDPEPFWNCTRNGTTFRVRAGSWDAFGQHYSIIQSIENQTVEYAMRHLVPPNTAVIDIGAAFGSYTLPFLVTGHPVYSFELETMAFHELMSQIRFNAALIRPEHINCYNFGLWSSEIIGDFYNMKNLKFLRLDDVLPDLTNVSFIKIDVEGAELEVMKGGAELIKRNQPNMWIECHEIFKPSITAKVIPYIKTLGFKDFTIREFNLEITGTIHLMVSKEA